VELNDAMRTTHACRYYKPDDVPDEVFYKAVEMARFGPQGGNRQPVRFIVVRDPDKKRQMQEWYLQEWKPYYNAAIESVATASDTSLAADSGTEKATWIGHAKAEKALRDADHFAEHIGEHPTMVVVCADISATHPTDTDLDRLSIVGGGSIYPLAQNLCLALRDQGVATTFTTLLVAHEPKVKQLLDIPDEYSTACHIVAGYPRDGFPKKLTRLPVEDLAFVDTYGNTLTNSDSAVA
jgi:nitroreductase